MGNIYLEKIAGAYGDMNDYRRNLWNEARNVYHQDWDGNVPSSVFRASVKEFEEQSELNDSEYFRPELMGVIQYRMQKRHVGAGLEEKYGNPTVREADKVAHNGASWKALTAGLAGGAAAGGLGILTKNQYLAAGLGVIGAGTAGYFTAKKALHSGEEKANAYLERISSRLSE